MGYPYRRLLSAATISAIFGVEYGALMLALYNGFKLVANVNYANLKRQSRWFLHQRLYLLIFLPVLVPIDQNVQECDARMNHSSKIAGIQKSIAHFYATQYKSKKYTDTLLQPF